MQDEKKVCARVLNTYYILKGAGSLVYHKAVESVL